MLYHKGHLARPLDAVLSNSTRLAVLRVLALSRGPLSGRAIARMGGVNHQAAWSALQALREFKLVRARAGGAATSWELTSVWLVDNALRPLFAAERRCVDELSSALREVAEAGAESVLVCGPAALGRLEPGRPVDVAVIAPSGRRGRVSEALADVAADFQSRFALELSAAVLSREQAVADLSLLDAWQLYPEEGRPAFFTPSRPSSGTKAGRRSRGRSPRRS